MAVRRTRTVGRLQWLRLKTGERLTTCGRFWLVPYGRSAVWWLYMRNHAGDLRRTTWSLVYRSHKLATSLNAAAIAHRGYLLEPVLERRGRAVQNALVEALDAGELKQERFDDAVAPLVNLWGAR